MKYLTNLELATLFRKMAAAYQILNENHFKIVAYERAADSVEHLTSEVKDLWDDGKLAEIPGVGSTIIGHIDELFRTGKNKHFDAVMSKVPQGVFPLLLVPGIGPKKAYRLVKELGLDNAHTVVEDLKKACQKGKVAPLDGFGDKSQSDILENIATYKKGAIKEKRILLSEADAIAHDLVDFLTKEKSIEQIDVLGSLRRCVATIGDIDLAIVTKTPKKAVDYFCTYPHQKIIEQGPTGASLLLHNGRQVDLRVQDKASYGAMLQYFTGSKNHNIKLRTYALSRGMSLSEYGIKIMKNAKLPASSAGGRMTNDHVTKEFSDEKEFYQYLGMEWIPPELREDRGEVEAALRSAQGKQNGLPNLVQRDDIKGDFHIHTSFNLEPSHDLGKHTIEEVLDHALTLRYAYIGISDHNPSVSKHTEKEIVTIMEKRKMFYEAHTHAWNEKTGKQIHVFPMLEVDIKPDGELALPKSAFRYVDAVIASIHSSFGGSREEMTTRILRALDHPQVKIFGHPTGRLLNQREGYDANWPEIFRLCASRNIAVEINASPYRLDLPDALIYDAKALGVRFTINTDAHAVPDMDMMQYGVATARRGWAEKRDIWNTSSYNEVEKWLVHS